MNCPPCFKKRLARGKAFRTSVLHGDFFKPFTAQPCNPNAGNCFFATARLHCIRLVYLIDIAFARYIDTLLIRRDCFTCFDEAACLRFAFAQNKVQRVGKNHSGFTF